MTTDRVRLFPVLAALFLAFAAAPALSGVVFGAEAGEGGGVLERKLTLNLWGAGLDDLAVEVKKATGADIVFYLPDLPKNQNTDNVYIVTGEVALGTILEALAKRFAFRFRVSEAGRIELSRGYGWVPDEPALRFARMACLSVEDDCDIDGMRRYLGEFLKPLPLLGGDFTLRLESYPVPDNPQGLRATAVMPADLAGYFVRSVRCLSGDAGDAAPRSAVEQAALFASARHFDNDWEALLTRPIEDLHGNSLREILADAARQTRTAIVLRAPPSRDGSLPTDVFRFTFGRLCETVSRRWELGKRTFLSCGAVVFERGTEDVWEMDTRSRELFWNGLAVAGFDVRQAAARAGGGANLLTVLRREIYPAVWRDPACAMAFSPVTGRLAIVAPLNVVQAIARRVEPLR